jgi:hypothetical protein
LFILEKIRLVCSIDPQDNLSIITCLLSSIISEIELEEYEISSVLHSLVSSVDDGMRISKQSSSLPLIIPSSIPLSKEHSIPTQRACHAQSSIRRKATTPTSSMPIISTELS